MPVASPNYLHQGGNSLNVSTSSSSQPKSTAVLLVNSRGEYLLHLRDAYKTICDPGTRYQVDGGPEPGETLDEAIAREIPEETGLILPGVTPYTSAQAHGPNVTEGNIQVYTARWDGAAHDLPVSDGITFAWFDVATMEQLPMYPWAHEVIKAHHAEHPAPQVPGPRDGTGQGGAGAVKNEIGAHLFLEREAALSWACITRVWRSRAASGMPWPFIRQVSCRDRCCRINDRPPSLRWQGRGPGTFACPTRRCVATGTSLSGRALRSVRAVRTRSARRHQLKVRRASGRVSWAPGPSWSSGAGAGAADSRLVDSAGMTIVAPGCVSPRLQCAVDNGQCRISGRG
ncbi:hypothetical protein C5746_39355 [Streptomyces atratus]|uniref:Nudix hydrolase domain-containing protein n=2 Tax=Streptomyces atratus TaxID=1893 RepID=A0A2Z5JS70_STRAR|nr:hypothetical protein C5746_39355 [Streptomyces atratus]